MEVHQLRYALAVADAGSFTAAADSVRVSQSGVSTQVQKLERELGVALFERSTRRVTLTAEGHRLIPRMRAALAALDAVAAEAERLHGLMVGTVRVGTTTGLTWAPLFDAIATLHRDHPGIDVRLREATSEELIAALERRDVDVAVAAWSGTEPAAGRVLPVIEDDLVAVVPPGHRFADAATVSPDELATADLIALPHGTGARSALAAVLGDVGLPVRPRWDVANPAAMLLLVERGLGVGVASASTIAAADGVVSVPIDHPAARSSLGVLWPESPSLAARALVERLPILRG